MLLFIDTNIFLDFYQMRGGQVANDQLKQLDGLRSRIITSHQVEMEYKKNRQKVIIETLGNIKSPKQDTKITSPILLDSKAVEIIHRNVDDVEKQQKKLKNQIDKILRNPNRNDPVYKWTQKLFKTKSELNLDIDTNKDKLIRREAWRRFMLGRPPRKNDDTSIGDAVNWEWIIDCAERRNDDVIIVSRDSDFGITHGKEVFINDWLRQEFKERVNQRKNITLTNRLTDALKKLKIPVTEEQIKEEQALIDKWTQIADRHARLIGLLKSRDYDLDKWTHPRYLHARRGDDF